jgi:hypothetical protein
MWVIVWPPSTWTIALPHPYVEECRYSGAQQQGRRSRSSVISTGARSPQLPMAAFTGRRSIHFRMSRICRARGTRILNQHFPSAEGDCLQPGQAVPQPLNSIARDSISSRTTNSQPSNHTDSEALGFPISSRRAGLATHRLLQICHHTGSLSLVAEEGLQHVHAARGQHSAGHLDLVVRLGMVQHLHHGVDCARLGIFGSVD